MDIHVVQPGETITSIADQYGVSAARLILDNELTDPNNLVIGQTLVVLYPEQTYTVREGDSLSGIADAHGVTVMQLLRNNPYLYNRQYIYPGETIVISYNNNQGELNTIGYTNPFISRDILRKTLPFLTYLIIFGYQATADGEIIDIEDTEIVQLAKQYSVAPIMLLSLSLLQGKNDSEISSILENDELIDRQIDNILNVLKAKGLYGVLVSYQQLNSQNILSYNYYTGKLATRLNNEGYQAFVSLYPYEINDMSEVTFDRLDYSVIGREANRIVIMNYAWGLDFGPPLPSTSLPIISGFLDYAVTLIPPEKLFVGVPVIGYNWELPYSEGISSARYLSLDAVIDLARDSGAIIQFDEVSQTPFFEYYEIHYGASLQHIVWFVDARTIDAVVKTALEYDITGSGIWNIMNYFAQLWLVINSQYKIEKIPLDNLL